MGSTSGFFVVIPSSNTLRPTFIENRLTETLEKNAEETTPYLPHDLAALPVYKVVRERRKLEWQKAVPKPIEATPALAHV